MSVCICLVTVPLPLPPHRRLFFCCNYITFKCIISAFPVLDSTNVSRIFEIQFWNSPCRPPWYSAGWPPSPDRWPGDPRNRTAPESGHRQSTQSPSFFFFFSSSSLFRYRYLILFFCSIFEDYRWSALSIFCFLRSQAQLTVYYTLRIIF